MGWSRRYEKQGLLAGSRSSISSRSSEDTDFELDAVNEALAKRSPGSSFPRWCTPSLRTRLPSPSPSRHYFRTKRRRSLLSRICHHLSLLPYIVLSLVLICGVFFPSYTYPPNRYNRLRTRVQRQALHERLGGGNVDNEKIFIVASLYDKEGELLSGHWGHSVQSLVKILGPENVFVSIYQNDPDERSKQAMDDFRTSLRCDSAIEHEHFDGSDLPPVIMPDGSNRVGRLAFLAEVRNRALRPLEDEQSPAYHTRWDRLLYVNDVAFDPIDAVNLLFNTHVDRATGKAMYRAACAVDFINPFKFYDTFATRDTEGYDMGVPFYPWFTNAGSATSRNDVLSQKDAVRVKSCWGGMVAYEAKWFQTRLYDVEGNDLVPKQTAPVKDLSSDEVESRFRPTNDGYQSPNGYDFTPRADSDPDTSSADEAKDTGNSLPGNAAISSLRFRAETDTFWGASECCLINADLAHLPLGPHTPADSTAEVDTGIYVNPYIRVAYDPTTLYWLSFTRRFERLYSLIHRLVNIIGRRPGFNPRQFEQPGEEVVDRVWRWDEPSLATIEAGAVDDPSSSLKGRWEDVKRVAGPGAFCGGRRALYLKEKADGSGHWGDLRVPEGG